MSTSSICKFLWASSDEHFGGYCNMQLACILTIYELDELWVLRTYQTNIVSNFVMY